MPLVRTVLGDVEADSLGFFSAHDHVLIAESVGTLRQPDLLVDGVPEATREVAAFVAAGGGGLVDAMPVDCGRDPAGLIAVSKSTGAHIVATTGFHKSEYYKAAHWCRSLGTEVIADLLVAEITEGMDRWSYGAPVIERLPARAGLVKVATGDDGLTPLVKRQIKAIGEVHSRTGVAVLTHTERGAFAFEQLQELEAAGVPASAVIISHVDRNHDPRFHRELAATGAYLCYDGPSRTKYHRPEQVVALIAEAAAAGAEDRILIGMDLALRSYRTFYGGSPGLAWLPSIFLGVLESMGVSEREVRKYGWLNPAAALALRAGPG